MGIVILFFLIGSIGSGEPAIFLRVILNGLAGVFVILAVNYIGAEMGFYIGINPFTLGMVSIFGIPGFISVAALAWLI